MIVYGSKQCPDTMACLESLKKGGTPFEFRDLADLAMLKEFLHYRDTSPLYDAVKGSGRVGIPLIVADDGSLSIG